MKTNVRKITDPYYGRGISATISTDSRTYDFSPTIGLTDKVIGLSLAISPPFSYQDINEGNEDLDIYGPPLTEVCLTVYFLWVVISIPFYTYPSK